MTTKKEFLSNMSAQEVDDLYEDYPEFFDDLDSSTSDSLPDREKSTLMEATQTAETVDPQQSQEALDLETAQAKLIETEYSRQQKEFHNKAYANLMKVGEEIAGYGTGFANFMASAAPASLNFLNELSKQVPGINEETGIFPNLKNSYGYQFAKEQEKISDQMPGSELTKELGTLLNPVTLPALGGKLAVQGGNMLGRLGKNLVQGGALGAVAQAASDVDTTFNELKGSAALGAVAQGAAGAVLPSVASLIGLAFNRLTVGNADAARIITKGYEDLAVTKADAKRMRDMNKELGKESFITPGELLNLPNLKAAEQQASPQLQQKIAARNEGFRESVKTYVNDLPGDVSGKKPEVVAALNSKLKAVEDSYREKIKPLYEKAYEKTFTPDEVSLLNASKNVSNEMKFYLDRYDSIKASALKKIREPVPSETDGYLKYDKRKISEVDTTILTPEEKALIQFMEGRDPNSVAKYDYIQRMMGADLDEFSRTGKNANIINSDMHRIVSRTRSELNKVMSDKSKEYGEARQLYSEFLNDNPIFDKSNAMNKVANIGDDFESINKIIFNRKNKAEMLQVKKALLEADDSGEIWNSIVKNEVMKGLDTAEETAKELGSKTGNIKFAKRWLETKEQRQYLADMLEGNGSTLTKQKLDVLADIQKTLAEAKTSSPNNVSGVFDLVQLIGKSDLERAFTNLVTSPNWDKDFAKVIANKNKAERTAEMLKLLMHVGITSTESADTAGKVLGGAADAVSSLIPSINAQTKE